MEKEILKQVREAPRILPLEEEMTLRTAESLMANYKEAQQAVLELIDNAIDNKIPGKPMIVYVRIEKNAISIRNHGGHGLDYQGLKNFMRWGYSDKTEGQIGKFGVGGKSAMGFLGRRLEVECSKAGSLLKYKFEDPDWRSKGEEVVKKHECREEKTDDPEGSFVVRISDVERVARADHILTKLSDIYKPLIENNQVTIYVNGKVVPSLEIKYLMVDPNFEPKIYKVSTGLKDRKSNQPIVVSLKVGVIEEGQKLTPGIRCAYFGRVIEDGLFFDHPTPAQLPQASRLIGEVALDHCSVTTNKANFIRDDIIWRQTNRAIHIALQDYINRLSTLKIEQSSTPEEWEKKLVKDAKRILEHIVAKTGIITKGDLPGSSGFRLSPHPREEPPKPPTGKKREVTKPPEGATAPTLEADVGPTVKRWGIFDDWDVRPFGRVDKRCELVVEDGKEILAINSNFKLYGLHKRAGETSLQVYVLDTVVREVCKATCQDKPLTEYIKQLDNFGNLIGEHFPEGRDIKGRGLTVGSITNFRTPRRKR